MMRVGNLIASTDTMGYTTWARHTKTITIDMPWFTYIGDEVHDYIYERSSVRTRVRQGIMRALYPSLGEA